MLAHGIDQLGPHGFGAVAQQRQVAVGGGAGEQVEHSVLLQLPEAVQQLAAALDPALAGALQGLGQGGGSAAVAGWGLLQQQLALGEPVGEACAQHGIADQAQQGWREPEAEAGPLGRIIPAVFQHLQQRQIALQQGLEVPVFLQRAGLAVPDEGEMGMKDQGQGACGHRPSINEATLRGTLL